MLSSAEAVITFGPMRKADTGKLLQTFGQSTAINACYVYRDALMYTYFLGGLCASTEFCSYNNCKLIIIK